jgi:hypothetical protein
MKITNAFEHSDYIRMSYYHNDIRGCFNCSWFMFNVDSHKSITVDKTGATSTPNRDSSMSQQISRYNHFNTKVHPGRFYFNPFLESHNQLIPPAKYGTVLKLQWLILVRL